jgi:hypothetical protein
MTIAVGLATFLVSVFVTAVVASTGWHLAQKWVYRNEV